MSKFHINKHGVPAPCRAKEGNCPYGGSDSHYDTYEEAQVAANKQNESKYGALRELKTTYYTADRVSIQVGDKAYIVSDGMGGELVFSDYEMAYEEANRPDEDGGFYAIRDYELGIYDPIEPEEVDVDEGYISYLNREKFKPSRIRSEDGKILKPGDEYYSYYKIGKGTVIYADKSVAEENFNKDKEAGLINNNPMNNPYKKKILSSRELKWSNTYYKDGDRSYSIPDEINDKFINKSITNKNIDKVLDSSLNEGSYIVNYRDGKGETLKAEMVKVEDGKYFIRGEVQKEEEGFIYTKKTGNITFTADDIRNEINKKGNISPADIFEGIHSIIKKKNE